MRETAEGRRTDEVDMRYPGQRGSARGGGFNAHPSHRGISTVFLVVLAATLTGGVLTWLNTTASTTSAERFAVFVFVFGLYFTVLCLHEFGHAYAAHKGGDDSIAARGYLDLNPLRYMNPVLSLLLPAIYLIIGALPLPGGAVLVNRAAIRSKREASLVSAAGPLTNVVAAGVSMALIALFAPTVNIDGSRAFTSGPHVIFWMALSFFAYLQLAVAILNLIPVPGLDGYGIIEPYLRYETRRALEPVRPYGILVVFVLLIALPPLHDAFSTLINDILKAAGQPADGPGFGQYLFQFWRS
jgi:Zn-dependent protease